MFPSNYSQWLCNLFKLHKFLIGSVPKELVLSRVKRIFIKFSVRIRNYSGPHFSRKCGKCGKNADQNNSEYGLFLRSAHQIYCQK